MANTSPQAQRPASQDVTSSAGPIHKVWVNNVCVSIFAGNRVTIQRRYFKPDKSTGYAGSIYPEQFADAHEALKRAEVWIDENVDESAGDKA